jgi:hypothetical protein
MVKQDGSIHRILIIWFNILKPRIYAGFFISFIFLFLSYINTNEVYHFYRCLHQCRNAGAGRQQDRFQQGEGTGLAGHRQRRKGFPENIQTHHPGL